MKRVLTTTAIALFIGAAPALAVEDSSKMDEQSTLPEASESAGEPSSALPSEPGTTPEQSEPSQPQAAAELEAGEDGQLPTQPGVSPDVAKEATEPNDGSPDESGGAMERSSAPPESGAASGGGTAASDLPTPESEIDRGPAAAEKSPDTGSETSKE